MPTCHDYHHLGSRQLQNIRRKRKHAYCPHGEEHNLAAQHNVDKPASMQQDTSVACCQPCNAGRLLDAPLEPQNTRQQDECSLCLEEQSDMKNQHAMVQSCASVPASTYLRWGCLELLEQLGEEVGVLLQLVEYLHIVHQHHALQRGKGLVVQHLGANI